MHVTTQSSFLIILRVCWRPTRSSRRSCRTTSSLPWSSARRYKLNPPHTSWRSSLVLWDKTISSRALPSVSIEAKGTVEAVIVVRGQPCCLIEQVSNYNTTLNVTFTFSGLKCQHVITCLQFDMTYTSLTSLSFWLKRSFIAFMISLLRADLIGCNEPPNILYKM